jgi:putative inorganic carbon (HCO3(-)) transporter
MQVRDIVITLLVLGAVPFILSRPHIGVLVFSWISYMNPHRNAWGFAYNFPFAMITGVATIAGFLFSREPKRVPVSSVTILWGLFVLWTCVTTYFALEPGAAFGKWDRTIKIQIMVLMTLILISNRERIFQLIWVIAISLGFYGIKGGIFAVLTGGHYRVWGPPDSFITGNNELALALLMVLPLMRFLQMQAGRKSIRWALTVAMVLCGVSILASYSRGAFVGGAALTLVLWWRSRNRFAAALFLASLIAAGVVFMPSGWMGRMQTIETYQEDASAMGRVNAWWFAYHLANDRPIIGGGFRAFSPDLFQKYAPAPDDFHDAHSIYFEVLGEQGYVGFALFLLLWISTYRTGGWIARACETRPDMAWAADLSVMLQAGVIAYAVGGLFLGLAYFDLPYHLMALLVVTQAVVKKELEKKAQEDRAVDMAHGPSRSMGRGLG